jgi:hypothetical protein
LRNTSKWKDLSQHKQDKASSLRRKRLNARDIGSNGAEGEGNLNDERPMEKKKAKLRHLEVKEDLAESSHRMAEESRRKRIISEEALKLQHEELQERMKMREERIMS